MKQDQNDCAEITIANLRQELDDWLGRKGFKKVSFKENQNLTNAPTADYKVVYEAQFIPDSSSQAELEIVVTEKGYLGVGFETRQRVAERLKVRNSRDGFADGFEPRLLQISEVLLLLDLVSAGEVIIQARIIPRWGLGQTKAMTMSKREGADAIFSRFYFATSLRVGFWTKTLTFEPWN